MRGKTKKGFFYYLLHVFKPNRSGYKITKKQYSYKTKHGQSSRRKESLLKEILFKPFIKNKKINIESHRHSKNNSFFKKFQDRS